MSTFFASPNSNNNYIDLHKFSTHEHNQLKHSKHKNILDKVSYKVHVISKTPNSHYKSKVSYMITISGPHLKTDHVKMIALFKLSTKEASSGSWNIEKEHFIK